MTFQSDKKKFDYKSTFSKSASKLSEFIAGYRPEFLCHRYDNSPTALDYILGLVACEKNTANLERMEEAIDQGEYRRYQQFISNSKWDHSAVLSKVQLQASEVLAAQKRKNGKPTGLIVDESSHVKKGKMSVGVSRQYAGSVGKVDNCQVGVYASLCNASYATLVNEKLFLPKNWVEDKNRCDKSDIPGNVRQFKTKPQLALELVDECVANGVAFDWVGGDGLYGHSYELGSGLDRRGLFFVLDVHKDETVFLEEPILAVPPRQGNKGRKPMHPKPDREPVRLDSYVMTLSENDWTRVKVRKTVKGWLCLLVHKCTVWSWNGKEASAKKRTLLITRTEGDKPKTKYSFSNGELEAYTSAEYAYFQSQRYWVERTFDDSKNELGLSDYQVRKWTGWHHHHALVFMATLFMMNERIENGEDIPLLSVRDYRILMVVSMFGTPNQFQTKWEQMITRHLKRQRDIDRYYQHEDEPKVVK
ncbi:IS701 family transposase [Algoriphagus resistens]|uniref:IS701 family transposase n=1 Tax=Algoriphagus resistens TaxID=1750590 RepID=UPI000716AA8E|nr:IS701 family transposase [Algoriphagus resistens]